jgi:hypothetical protein
MIVEETFYRPDEVAREARTLPAATYQLARRLLGGGGACVFVPIRSMQVLAVLDGEEFIFVDREGGRSIDIAWQHFRPGERAALDAPVPYEAAYYSVAAPQTLSRLQGEFQKALAQLASRATTQTAAQIVELPVRQR